MLRKYQTRYQDRIKQQKIEQLFDSARNNNLDPIDKLINEGFDVDTRDPLNRTALMEASKRGHHNVVQKLLDAGADVDATDFKGLTALMEACAISRASAETLSTIKLLIAKGASLELKSLSFERSALYRAVAFGCTDIVSLLIENGADIEATGDYAGYTPLMKAVLNDDDAVAKILLEKGAKTLVKNDKGNTPIELAKKGLNAKTFCLLNNFSKPSFQARLEALDKEIEIPSEYKCPITQVGFINDPVTVASGQTYDRDSLVKYFALKHFPNSLPCPITKIEIQLKELFNPPSKLIKDNLETFVVAQEEAAKQRTEKGKKRLHSELESRDTENLPKKLMRHAYNLFSQQKVSESGNKDEFVPPRPL